MPPGPGHSVPRPDPFPVRAWPLPNRSHPARPYPAAAFTAVGLLPCGKPITVPTRTPVPRSCSTAAGTSQGRTQTEATAYFAAIAHPSCAVNPGRRME